MHSLPRLGDSGFSKILFILLFPGNFQIYEGERQIASGNRQLGEFEIRPLPNGKAGEVSTTEKKNNMLGQN